MAVVGLGRMGSAPRLREVHFLFVKANSRRSTSTSLLHAEIGVCELLTFLQLIDPWGELTETERG